MGYRDYLRRVRLRQAANLLATTAICIKEIASSVGYKYLSDFYHHFKVEYKMSPAQFRLNQNEVAGLQVYKQASELRSDHDWDANKSCDDPQNGESAIEE